MAVSRYFNNFPSENRFNNEHMLMEDVIAESIQIMGHNVYYIPRESYDSGDIIFGEFANSKFEKAYLIEAYIANVEGFEGQGDFFSKFGLEIRDTSNFVLSRRSFSRIVPTVLRDRPREGDLVYVPLMHRMFEIKFIEKKLMFFSVGNRHPYVYEMRCEDFRFSEENINTGIDEVDAVAIDNAYTIKVNVDGGTNQEYEPGEIVFQSSNNYYESAYAEAKVKEWYSDENYLLLYDIKGQLTANNDLVGQTTGTVYNLASVADERSDFVLNDEYDNLALKTEIDAFLDLSEVNPFGTP